MEIRVGRAEVETFWGGSAPHIRHGYGGRGAQWMDPAVSGRAGPRSSSQERNGLGEPLLPVLAG